MPFGLPKDCCSGETFLDFSKADILKMESIVWSDVNLWIAMATIIFNPFYWNVLARWEYRSKGLSRLFGDRYVACTVLAVSIFLLGLYRDLRFNAALDSQPRWPVLQDNAVLWFGYICVVTGTVLVVTSYLNLGFYGTFLGDYFGILMDERVTSFPFNVTDNPMYWGSVLNFLGGALVKASQCGILLSGLVAVCYKIAITFEEPFTAKIYAERDASSRKRD